MRKEQLALGACMYKPQPNSPHMVVGPALQFRGTSQSAGDCINFVKSSGLEGFFDDQTGILSFASGFLIAEASADDWLFLHAGFDDKIRLSVYRNDAFLRHFEPVGPAELAKEEDEQWTAEEERSFLRGVRKQLERQPDGPGRDEVLNMSDKQFMATVHSITSQNTGRE